MKRKPTCLTIAGFDGSGGAGILADIKTFEALGCHGLSILTALPVQNTKNIKYVYPIEPQCVKDQIEHILDDCVVDAVKIGMIHQIETAKLINSVLEKGVNVPIVLDPIFSASSGFSFIKDGSLRLVLNSLVSNLTCITPNLFEASVLLDRPISTPEEIEEACYDLSRLGLDMVVITGGDDNTEEETCKDCVYIQKTDRTHWIQEKRIHTKNNRGTGCTFSSAIVANIAKGHDLLDAVKLAKAYLVKALDAGKGFKLGKGNGPLSHLVDYQNVSSIPATDEEL